MDLERRIKQRINRINERPSADQGRSHNRLAARETVSEKARIIYLDGSILARVADHSETGAKLVLKKRTNLPEHFKVEATIYSGQVEKVWQRGKAIGVRKRMPREV